MFRASLAVAPVSVSRGRTGREREILGAGNWGGGGGEREGRREGGGEREGEDGGGGG